MKNQDFKITNPGLQELKEDDRDLVLGNVFGYISIKDVPDTDFIVSKPLKIKDQGDTDFCSAFAVTSVSEDQEGIELLPEYQFFSTKRITKEFEEWGADLRSAMKSAVKFGSVPTSTLPQMAGRPRSFILNEANWPKNVDHLAKEYSKETYFKIEGKHDCFDNIRASLWQHRGEKSTIVTGAKWINDWVTVKNGIIREGNGDGFGHAFKLFGQKVIDGEIFLVAQLSNGENIGDSGIFYFNREIANREFGKYGCFMFKDIDRETAEFYSKQPFTLDTPWYSKILLLIINLFKN